MNKIKFSQLPRPHICTMIAEGELEGAIKAIREAEFAGSDSFGVTLMGDGKMGLKKKYLNKKDLHKLFTCTTKPILVGYSRWHYLREPISITEDERMEILLMAAEAGASIIDMEGDFFDPIPGPEVFTEESKKYSLTKGNPPREYTTNPEAVEKQKQWIQRFHDLGVEVQYSCHTRVHLTPDDAIRIYKDLASRGADVVKIVSVDACYEDLMETLLATAKLREIETIPYVMMSHGEHGIFARWFAPFLGSMLCFVQNEYTADGFYLQPLLKNVRQVFDSVKFITPTKDPWEANWL